jgi:hypothetical protein
MLPELIELRYLRTVQECEWYSSERYCTSEQPDIKVRDKHRPMYGLNPVCSTQKSMSKKMAVIPLAANRVQLCTQKEITKEPNSLFARTHRQSPEAAAVGLENPVPVANVETEEGSLGTACL